MQTRLEALQRRESHSWYLLAAVCILTTAGLAFAITPLLFDRVDRWWPWANTHLVLMVGLSISTTLLVAYMTVQKRKTAQTRRHVEGVIQDALRRERQNAARLQALLNISHMMGSLSSLELLFDAITRSCVELLECQQASLMLVNSDTHMLEIRATTGHVRSDAVSKASVKIGDGIAGWVAQTQTPLILNADTDLSQYPGLQLKDSTITAAMVVPIVLRDELVGVLNVSSRAPGARYAEDDLQAMQVFAENAGTCIRHTEHVEWMRQALQEAMQTLATLRKGEGVRLP